MKKIKSFTAGIVLGCVRMSSITAFAGNTQTIQAVFNEVKLVVNGQQVNKETLLYNGTTYVPLRAVAETLGEAVDYDQATKTAYIGEKPVVATNGYSIDNPAPVGVTQRVSDTFLGVSYTLDVKVAETIRGDKAWEIIKDANMFNSEPESGKEFILAKIYVKNVACDSGKKVDVDTSIISLYSEKNEELDGISYNVPPSPELRTSLYQGAETTGYVIFEVAKGDNPKIAIGRKYDGTGGIWFKLS